MSFCPYKFMGIGNAINHNYDVTGCDKIEDYMKRNSNCEGKECGMYNYCHGIKFGRKIHILEGDKRE